MDIELTGSRALATRNRNRNMVLALLQRVPQRPNGYPLWADGLSRFGVTLLCGIGEGLHLCGEDLPYEWLPDTKANDA